MQEDKTPNIFISYSRSSLDLTLKLAERLNNHGIKVVIDIWDLKEGQDKYDFMERSVNDPEITKVLIVCDKTYAQKADGRTGGVGDETVIISSEIYGKVKQKKFIPIIVEKNEDGEPYVPAYLKSRIYIDLSDPNTYEAEYEKLIRNIYEKPEYSRPNLGKKPEWLDDDKTDFFPVKDLISQIRGSSTNSKRKSCISRFETEYLEALKKYFEIGAEPERIYEIFLNTKPLRDIFLDFVESIAETEVDYAEVLAEYFETMYNHLICANTFELNGNLVSDNDLDVFKIHMWELFICVIVFMRHVKDYKAINIMLTYTYFLRISKFGEELEPNNYRAFRCYSRAIENGYKPYTEMKNKHTLVGDVLCNQREKLPIYTKEAIAEADVFLYQVYYAYDSAENQQSRSTKPWFPTCYVYADRMPTEWVKMKSRRYCKKMMELFGVDDIEGLKVAVSECKHDENVKYSDSWEAAPAILDCISVEEIGTLN